jgi:hypothetical protein
VTEDGKPKTFTLSKTITTVDTTPVTITTIETYQVKSKGKEVTKTSVDTVTYLNTSEIPCEDRHVRKDSIWEPNYSI